MNMFVDILGNKILRKYLSFKHNARPFLRSIIDKNRPVNDNNNYVFSI